MNMTPHEYIKPFLGHEYDADYRRQQLVLCYSMSKRSTRIVYIDNIMDALLLLLNEIIIFQVVENSWMLS